MIVLFGVSLLGGSPNYPNSKHVNLAWCPFFGQVWIDHQFVTRHHIASSPASHCISLHRIASHCIALHHIASHCMALHLIASHRMTLHHNASHCISLHDIASHRHAAYSFACMLLFRPVELLTSHCPYIQHHHTNITS